MSSRDRIIAEFRGLTNADVSVRKVVDTNGRTAMLVIIGSHEFANDVLVVVPGAAPGEWIRMSDAVPRLATEAAARKLRLSLDSLDIRQELVDADTCLISWVGEQLNDGVDVGGQLEFLLQRDRPPNSTIPRITIATENDHGFGLARDMVHPPLVNLLHARDRSLPPAREQLGAPGVERGKHQEPPPRTFGKGPNSPSS